MLSLSANFQTLLKKDAAIELKYLIKIDNSLVANPYTAGAFYYSIEYGTITDSSAKPVKGVLANNDILITESINIKEHTASVGGFSITLIDNEGNITDDFNTYNIYNKDVEIYLGEDSLTAIGDWLKVYQGIVKDWTVKDNLVTISIENSTFTLQKMIPQKLINTDDYPLTPAANIGKAIPLVYGDHPFYYGQDGSPTLSSHIQENNLVPAICVGMDSDEKWNYLVAGHALDTTDAAYYRVWMYDTYLNRYVKVDSTSVAFSTDGNGNTLLKINNLPFLYDYWFPNGTAEDTSINTSYINLLNCCDKNWTNYATATLSEHPVNTTNDQASLNINWNTYDGYQDDADINEIILFYKSYYNEGVAGNFTFQVTPGNDDASGSDGTTLDSITDPAATKGDVNDDVQFIAVKTAADGGTLEVRVYDVLRQIKYQSTEMFPVFVACKGREASATVAGHFTGLSSGDMLEIPAHIIDSILFDELASTNRDSTEMQAVATELANWKMAFDISEQKNSLDIFYKLAKQSKSHVFWDSANNCTIDTFFASNTTDRTIKINEIKGLPVVYKTKLADIVNDLIIKYKKDG